MVSRCKINVITSYSIHYTKLYDDVRIVRMNAQHEPDEVRRWFGDPIGWWDGDTLVVDTTNFTDHRSPYQIGVPSGAQKHVVELV